MHETTFVRVRGYQSICQGSMLNVGMLQPRNSLDSIVFVQEISCGFSQPRSTPTCGPEKSTGPRVGRRWNHVWHVGHCVTQLLSRTHRHIHQFILTSTLYTCIEASRKTENSLSLFEWEFTFYLFGSCYAMLYSCFMFERVTKPYQTSWRQSFLWGQRMWWTSPCIATLAVSAVGLPWRHLKIQLLGVNLG
jgi:hypothetical protein